MRDAPQGARLCGGAWMAGRALVESVGLRGRRLALRSGAFAVLQRQMVPGVHVVKEAPGGEGGLESVLTAKVHDLRNGVVELGRWEEDGLRRNREWVLEHRGCDRGNVSKEKRTEAARNARCPLEGGGNVVKNGGKVGLEEAGLVGENDGGREVAEGLGEVLWGLLGKELESGEK